MTGTFGARTRLLQQIVGDGTLRGKVTVNQAYAQRQHEDLTYRHVDGGGPYYLRRPLFARYASYLQDIARGILDDGGKRAMQQSMVNLATTELRRYVPSVYGNLRRSGHAQVFDQSALIFDRPAERARLSEAEIRAQGER